MRTLKQNDLLRAKEYMDSVNGIIEEDDYIYTNKKQTLKETKKYLTNMLKASLKKETIAIVAEIEKKIAGFADISSKKFRENHVAVIGITIGREYRGIGLGSQVLLALMAEGIRKLKEKPKIIELEVFETNKNAQIVYQKLGFKKVAELPNRVQRRRKLITKIIMEKYV